MPYDVILLMVDVYSRGCFQAGSLPFCSCIPESLDLGKKLLMLRVNPYLTNTVKVRSSVLSPSKPMKKSNVVDQEVLSIKLVKQIVDTVPKVKGQLEIEMKTVISDSF